MYSGQIKRLIQNFYKIPFISLILSVMNRFICTKFERNGTFEEEVFSL